MLDEPSKSNSTNPEICFRFNVALKMMSEGNRAEAISALESNIIEGCTDSMVLLGDMLSVGSDEERRRSISLFKAAADLGNNSGVRNLAYCYSLGINVDKDKEKGAKFYIKAAKMGNARAACNIGVMYDYGNGVEQNRGEALKWYKVSAEGGCTRGMTNLGEFYMLGKGTVRNLHEAIGWFEKSGSPRALYHLAEIYLDEKDYLDPAKGLEYLRKSADQEYSRALMRMGLLMEDENPTTAQTYYLKAASKGNKNAVERLKKLGIPVPEVSSRRKKDPED